MIRTAAALKARGRAEASRVAHARAVGQAKRVVAIQDFRRAEGLKPLSKAQLKKIDTAAAKAAAPKKKAKKPKPKPKPDPLKKPPTPAMKKARAKYVARMPHATAKAKCPCK